jgi:hypothetical protein
MQSLAGWGATTRAHTRVRMAFVASPSAATTARSERLGCFARDSQSRPSCMFGLNGSPGHRLATAASLAESWEDKAMVEEMSDSDAANGFPSRRSQAAAACCLPRCPRHPTAKGSIVSIHLSRS